MKVATLVVINRGYGIAVLPKETLTLLAYKPP